MEGNLPGDVFQFMNAVSADINFVMNVRGAIMLVGVLNARARVSHTSGMQLDRPFSIMVNRSPNYD